MTRKDYKLIAEAISWTMGQDQSDFPAHDTLDVLIQEFVLHLGKNNSKFDESKFKQYIGRRTLQIRDTINLELGEPV